MTGPIDDPDARPDALARLRREPALPPALEDRVVDSLTGHGLLRRGGPSRRAWLGGLAAAGLAAAAFGLGRRTAEPTVLGASAAPGTKWMLLLVGEPERPSSSEDRTARVEEYRRWAIGLRTDGLLLDGAELAPEVAVVGPPIAPDPGVESAPPRITGYFIIVADALQDAVAVAATCPHALRGGTVEVRPLGAT